MEKLYIVMPAYNESANIEAVVKQWHPVVEKIGNESKLVIVDDGSKDNTYEIMKNLSTSYPCFVPVTKPNGGHGATILYAYNYAINAGADYVFQTDSDGQTSPNEFWGFWDERNNADFVIGKRIGRQDGFSRKIVTRVLQMLVWVVYGCRIPDANTPFRLMKATQLKPIVDLIPPDFFLSNVMVSTIATLKKERIKFLPISFKPRQGGVNSINVKRIIKIGIKAIKEFYDFKKNIRHCLKDAKTRN